MCPTIIQIHIHWRTSTLLSLSPTFLFHLFFVSSKTQFLLSWFVKSQCRESRQQSFCLIVPTTIKKSTSFKLKNCTMLMFSLPEQYHIAFFSGSVGLSSTIEKRHEDQSHKIVDPVIVSQNIPILSETKTRSSLSRWIELFRRRWKMSWDFYKTFNGIRWFPMDPNIDFSFWPGSLLLRNLLMKREINFCSFLSDKSESKLQRENIILINLTGKLFARDLWGLWWVWFVLGLLLWLLMVWKKLKSCQRNF